MGIPTYYLVLNLLRERNNYKEILVCLKLKHGRVVMDNVLAFCQKRILYIPELLPLCGNSPATVICFTQLEYRSSGTKGDFYKFLSPCNHKAYRSGDSWTEELGFSEKVFRRSFDLIGKRYKSSSELQQVIEAGGDPFAGKLYLSYIDNISRLTYYRRNKKLINEQLSALLNQFIPHEFKSNETVLGDQCTKSNSRVRYPDAQREGGYIPKGQIGNRSKGRYPDAQTSAPYTKNTYKENTKNTAVMQEDGNTGIHEKRSSVAAAEFSIKTINPLIGQELDEGQQYFIRQQLRSSVGKKISAQEHERLYEEVCFVMTDEKEYPRAGDGFEYKLNCCLQKIKKGSWIKPFAMKKAVNKNQLKEINQRKIKIFELNSHLKYWYEQVTKIKNNGGSEELLMRCETKVGEYEHEIFREKSELQQITSNEN